MCSKRVIDDIDNGKAVVLDKRKFQYGTIITVVIFLLTQAVLFGVWKGTVDSKVDNFEVIVNQKMESMRHGGSDVSLENSKKIDANTTRIDNIIHNLKRLMERQGVRWETLDAK